MSSSAPSSTAAPRPSACLVSAAKQQQRALFDDVDAWLAASADDERSTLSVDPLRRQCEEDGVEGRGAPPRGTHSVRGGARPVGLVTLKSLGTGCRTGNVDHGDHFFFVYNAAATNYLLIPSLLFDY